MDKHSGALEIVQPSARDILKAFTPITAPFNTLRWDPSLDEEDGFGIRVALLDSGINWAEDTFLGANIRGRDFTGCGGLFDETNHGTSNASLLVGRSFNGVSGLVPNCELLVAKVFGQRDRLKTVLSVTSAIRWAVNARADIIILPFGTVRGSKSISRAIDIAVSQGCQVFAAAGNCGPEKIYFPARRTNVIAVSALSCDGSVLPECCSLEDVDLYCLGDNIPVTSHAQSISISGSSPATVLAAGLAALKKSRFKRQSM